MKRVELGRCAEKHLQHVGSIYIFFSFLFLFLSHHGVGELILMCADYLFILFYEVSFSVYVCVCFGMEG